MSEYVVIFSIVNEGFADSVMTAAREAGAKGGTVIDARGTANAEAKALFDIEISGEIVDNMYVVKISDDGIGIDEDKINHIYDKFYQVDSSHSTAGNGLGLSIVSEIIKMHNGRVEVLSKINQGTTFIVYLPIKEN